MADNGPSSGSVLLAFALGALAGAAVALLYAPASGEETRRRLSEKTREGRQRVASAVERGREAFEQMRSRSVAGEDGL
jgi:gas vesicle protein